MNIKTGRKFEKTDGKKHFEQYHVQRSIVVSSLQVVFEVFRLTIDTRLLGQKTVLNQKKNHQRKSSKLKPVFSTAHLTVDCK